MIFGAMNNKDKKSVFHPLSEEEIKNRLYGSGSAVVVASKERELAHKKQKAVASENLTQSKKAEEEQINIKKELLSLRKELEQTKRKLDRMRGVHIKKLRALVIIVILFITVAITAVAVLRYILRSTSTNINTEAGKLTDKAIFSIQVRVYDNLADARRFSAELRYKGYEASVKELSYKKGGRKFIVYVGGFQDKKSAMDLLHKLRSKEGIKDSFITKMPGE